ncbi:hypothetical protein C9439_03960 [archaeon SCG-AAA382B04]|nr:hypothetical protein C9439_03960 [archaeon SCG-AAA382B04]
MNPTLSIITPSYNQEDFIEENILSVKEQTTKEIEHVIIDGDSDDKTLEIIKEYEDEYNLRWISEPDSGQSEAINKGIEMAEGDWIIWLNADDFFLPNALKNFFKAKKIFKKADVIYGDLKYVNQDKKTIRKKYHTKPSKFIHKHWKYFTANHCTFFREEVLKEVRGVNEDLEYTMDIDLLWRVLDSHYKLNHIPEFIAAHRKHSEAKTYGKKTKKHKEESKRLRNMPDYSFIEKILPRELLALLAIFLQSTLFLREKRLEAIKHLYLKVINDYIHPIEGIEKV